MKIEINIDNSPQNPHASLSEIYVLDFDDNYHRLESEPTTEFERSVRKIRRRYKNLNDFNSALITYDAWMEYLAEKYGGHELLKRKIKYGLVYDYVPPKPKLKNTKELNYLFKNNIVISDVGRRLVDNEALDNYLDEIQEPETIEIDFVKKDKTIDKITQDYVESIGYKKSKSKKSDIDFMDEYFRLKNSSKKKGKKKKKHKNNNSSEISLKDLCSGKYLDKIKDTSYEDDTVMVIGGQFFNTNTSKELSVYHALNDMGWNSYKLMKKSNYGKSVTNIFKKNSKKAKKERKKRDKLLIDIMTDNGYDDFEQFARDMEDFTSSNVFK